MNEKDPAIGQQLTQEIIESQKIRSEYMKWKLIAIAGLAAAGLGLKEEITLAPITLLVIPFICFYTDALCYHISLRILGIGCYLFKSGYSPYEKFIRRPIFYIKWEDSIALGSSLIFSMMVIYFPVMINKMNGYKITDIKNTIESLKDFYAAAGCTGGILCAILYILYVIERQRIGCLIVSGNDIKEKRVEQSRPEIVWSRILFYTVSSIVIITIIFALCNLNNPQFLSNDKIGIIIIPVLLISVTILASIILSIFLYYIRNKSIDDKTGNKNHQEPEKPPPQKEE